MTTGRIPKDIGNCTLLNYLGLRDNQLTGSTKLSEPLIQCSINDVWCTELIWWISLNATLLFIFCYNFKRINLYTIWGCNYCIKFSIIIEINPTPFEEAWFSTWLNFAHVSSCSSFWIYIKHLNSYLSLVLHIMAGKIPHEIGYLQNLKLLDFGANNLTGLIPSIIFNNSNIEVIQLYGNHLSGNLPSSTGINLPNLLRLYLWGNNLSGVIPSSICNASKLTVLELSRNMFSGLVANTFGNCRQLQILNLAYNQLATGSISLEPTAGTIHVRGL